MQVYVDMDGVLADFDTHHERTFGRLPDRVADDVDWSHVNNHPDFFLGIDPMPDMEDLWRFVERLTPRPKVLTGVPASVAVAPDNKRAWVRKHLGSSVEVICCRSRDKSLHCQPGDLLIDDWEKYRDLWLAKGGRWITHRSAEDTISKMLNMAIIPTREWESDRMRTEFVEGGT
jgi:hypothetical protein